MRNIFICQTCKKEFSGKLAYDAGDKLRKYCSLRCCNDAKFNGETRLCHICDKETYYSKSRLKKSKSGLFFCSKSCHMQWKNHLASGPNHPNWKDGSSTYKHRLTNTEIQKICLKCKNSDERVLVVHHLDKNRKNNDVSNLVWLCSNCHRLVHHFNEEI